MEEGQKESNGKKGAIQEKPICEFKIKIKKIENCRGFKILTGRVKK